MPPPEPIQLKPLFGKSLTRKRVAIERGLEHLLTDQLNERVRPARREGDRRSGLEPLADLSQIELNKITLNIDCRRSLLSFIAQEGYHPSTISEPFVTTLQSRRSVGARWVARTISMIEP
jgi:hypothetical protein